MVVVLVSVIMLVCRSMSADGLAKCSGEDWDLSRGWLPLAETFIHGLHKVQNWAVELSEVKKDSGPSSGAHVLICFLSCHLVEDLSNVVGEIMSSITKTLSTTDNFQGLVAFVAFSCVSVEGTEDVNRFLLLLDDLDSLVLLELCFTVQERHDE